AVRIRGHRLDAAPHHLQRHQRRIGAHHHRHRVARLRGANRERSIDTEHTRNRLHLHGPGVTDARCRGDAQDVRARRKRRRRRPHELVLAAEQQHPLLADRCAADGDRPLRRHALPGLQHVERHRRRMRQRELEPGGDAARTGAERRQHLGVAGERMAAVRDAEPRKERTAAERLRHPRKGRCDTEPGERDQPSAGARPAHPESKGTPRHVRFALHMRLRCPTVEDIAQRKVLLRRAAWSVVASAAIAALAWKAITVPAGVPDPTAPDSHLGHGAVVVDSALLVFREGLEAVLVLAAFTASFVGANRALRKPVAAGASVALGASVLTWFVAIWVIGALGGPGLDVQAATGLLAVAVLLVVMNWFFHKVYWTGWIAAHNRRRRKLQGTSGAARQVLVGLALLGFTAVYREGFEVVLFLQNLRLKAGSTTVLDGVALGLALTVAVGIVTFLLQH